MLPVKPKVKTAYERMLAKAKRQARAKRKAVRAKPVDTLATRVEAVRAVVEYAPMAEYVASLGDQVVESSKSRSKCKKCGLPLAWKTLENGKWCPTNPDGSDHWDLCSATRNASRPFDPERDTKTSGVIVGKYFVELPPLPNGEAPWN